MSYQQSCEEYALYGDPMRDAFEYEEAAQYDRWDGHRLDMLGIDADTDYYPEPDHMDQWDHALWLESQAEEQLHYHWAMNASPDVPF